MSKREDTDDGFITVYRRGKKRHGSTKRKVRERVSRESVIADIAYVMDHYTDKDNVLSTFLYGSTARNTHNANSDIDILVIFKKVLPDSIDDLKVSLEDMFDRKIDLVCMTFKNKDIKPSSERDSFFLDNVYAESLFVFGSDYDRVSIRLSELNGLI